MCHRIRRRTVEKKLLFEISLSSAFGAVIGTILAVSFGWMWWLGVIGGVIVGGLSYKPKEAFAALSATSKEMTASLKGSYKDNKNKILLPLVKTVLVILWLASSYVSFRYVWPVELKPMDTVAMMIGCAIFCGTVIFMCSLFVGVCFVFSMDRLTSDIVSSWIFPLSLLCSLAVSLTEKLSWSSRLQEIMYEGASNPMSKKIVIGSMAIVAIVPIIIFVPAIFCAAILLLDIAITLILAIASTARLAVMEGSALGALAGYGSSLLQPDFLPWILVVTGLLVGGICGPLIYTLRVSLQKGMNSLLLRFQ